MVDMYFYRIMQLIIYQVGLFLFGLYCYSIGNTTFISKQHDNVNTYCYGCFGYTPNAGATSNSNKICWMSQPGGITIQSNTVLMSLRGTI